MEIVNLRPTGDILPGGSTVLALFDVQFEGTPIRLHHLQLRRYPDGSHRVMSPMTRVHGQDGRVRAYSLGAEISDTLASTALLKLKVLHAPIVTDRAA